MVTNQKPLFGVLFTGVYFAFAATLEEANEVAANAGHCPFTGLSAIVDVFAPGDLELVDQVWWFKDHQIVHVTDVPWLA